MKVPCVLPRAGVPPYDVVGFGENSLDDLLVVGGWSPGQKTAVLARMALPGGQVASALVGCARLGWRTCYIGRFGDDAAGTVGVESLAQEGVDVYPADRLPGIASRSACVIVDRVRHDRTVLWHRDPSLVWPPEQVPVARARAGRVLLVDGTDVEAALVCAREARSGGIPVVVDADVAVPRVEDLLHAVDIVIVDHLLAARLAGTGDEDTGVERLADQFPRAAVVCATLGARGSIARAGGRTIRTKGFSVACVDTTGAGDQFRAGFIGAWLACDGADLEWMLRYANATAALSCRGMGARSAAPRPQDVEDLLHSS